MHILNPIKRGLFWNNEGGGAGGTQNPPPATPPATPPVTPPAASAKPEDAAGQNKGGDDKPPEPDKKFSQAEVDNIIKDRLKREKEKAEKDAQKVREEAEAEALKKQGDFQKLAEKHEARVKELEAEQVTLKAKSEQADKYKAALEKFAESETKALPDHLKALLEKMDVADRLEYIAANREALTGKKEPAKPVPPTPPANGESSEADKQQARELAQRQTRSRF